mgnify:CR=1 FL=1
MELYYKILHHQGGVCELCHTVAKDGKFVLDHDHVTGNIRGVLCIACNSSLGAYERIVKTKGKHKALKAYIKRGCVSPEKWLKL